MTRVSPRPITLDEARALGTVQFDHETSLYNWDLSLWSALNPCTHSYVQHNPLDEYSSAHCEWCGDWRGGNQDDAPLDEWRDHYLTPAQIDAHYPDDLPF